MRSRDTTARDIDNFIKSHLLAYIGSKISVATGDEVPRRMDLTINSVAFAPADAPLPAPFSWHLLTHLFSIAVPRIYDPSRTGD